MAQQPVKDSDATIGRLVSDASRDLSSLIRNEIRLAKSEIQVSIKAGYLGVALLGVAGFFGLMSLIMLSIAAAFFIHWNGDGLSLHWAFLIVFGFYLLLAGVLALVGIRKIKKVRAPEKAIAQASETKQILKR
jgi:Putative Actinobacterial Holin-X, holin superfamily III